MEPFTLAVGEGDTILIDQIYARVQQLVLKEGSHHGKVRLSMRNVSRKKHNRYDDERLLGIKIDGDMLPEFISDIISTKETALDISLAQIGRRNSESSPSWTEMAVGLRDKYGPFRLAYLEMLVRAADVLASKKEREQEGAVT